MIEPDDELVHALRAASRPPGPPDVDAALARVHQRSLVVGRQRAVVRGGAFVAAVAAVGALWLASRPSGQTQLDTVSSPTPPSLPATTVATTATSSATSVPTTPATTTTLPAIAAAAPPAPTAPPTSHGGSGTQGSRTSSFHGRGGNVFARVQAGSLVLVAVNPSSGFVVTRQQADPEEIAIRFSGDAGATRITLRLVDGRISPTVEESTADGHSGPGEGHGGPVDTGDGDHGHGGDGGGGHDGGDGRGRG